MKSYNSPTSSPTSLSLVPLDMLKKEPAWQIVYQCEKDFDRIIMGNRRNTFAYLKYDAKDEKQNYRQEKDTRWLISNPEKINTYWSQDWNMAFWAAGIVLKKEFHLISPLYEVVFRACENLYNGNLLKHGPGGVLPELLWLIDNHYEFEFKTNRVIASPPKEDYPCKMYNYYDMDHIDSSIKKLLDLYKKVTGKTWDPIKNAVSVSSYRVSSKDKQTSDNWRRTIDPKERYPNNIFYRETECKEGATIYLPSVKDSSSSDKMDSEEEAGTKTTKKWVSPALTIRTQEKSRQTVTFPDKDVSTTLTTPTQEKSKQIVTSPAKDVSTTLTIPTQEQSKQTVTSLTKGTSYSQIARTVFSTRLSSPIKPMRKEIKDTEESLSSLTIGRRTGRSKTMTSLEEGFVSSAPFQKSQSWASSTATKTSARRKTAARGSSRLLSSTQNKLEELTQDVSFRRTK